MIDRYLLLDWVSLLDDLPSAVLQTNRAGEIIYANKSAESLLDYWKISLGESLPAHLLPWVADVIERNMCGQTYSVEDRTYWFTACYVEEQQRINIYIEDITRRQKLEKTIETLRTHSILKQLPTLEAFKKHLARKIMAAKRNHYLIGLFIIELEDLQQLTGRFGHYIGDVLLNMIAERLINFVPLNSIITRILGNDFAVAIPNLKEVFEIETMVEELREHLRVPFIAKGYRLAITTTVGVAIAPVHDEDPDKIIKKARIAVQSARAQRQVHKGFYDETLEDQFERHEYLAKELIYALNKHQLKIFYEPRISLKSGNIIGAEALLRWEHERLGLITPTHFIPIAEENGLIHEIGLWVLESVFAQLDSWSRKGFGCVEISVNLSPLQFMGEGLEKTFDFFYNKYSPLIKINGC